MLDQQRLNALTGLRFIAAFAIVVHHLAGILWLPADALSPFDLQIGVSFFFCLSGFILHYNYRGSIRDIPYYQFVFVRYFRLWPAHLAALVLAALLTRSLSAWFAGLDTSEVLQVFFLGHSLNPSMDVFYGLNGPSWSISTEVIFYLSFPFLCISVTKRPIATMLSVAALVLAYLALAQAFLLDPAIRGAGVGLGSISPFPRLLEFAAGAVVCELLFRAKPVNRTKPVNERDWLWTSLEIALLAAIVACNGFLAPWVRSASLAAFGPVFESWAGAAICFPLFCALIGVMSFERGVVSRLLATAPMVWLGNVSFAIYLVHQRWFYFFRRNFPDWDLGTPLEVILVAVAVLGSATAIYYLVERPGIRLSRQVIGFRRRTTRPQPG